MHGITSTRDKTDAIGPTELDMFLHGTTTLEDFRHICEFLVDMHFVRNCRHAFGYNFGSNLARSQDANFVQIIVHAAPNCLHEAAQIQDILRYFMSGIFNRSQI